MRGGSHAPPCPVVSDDKNPIEQAVDQAMDAFVYAPIGLVFDGPGLFPTLVDKGRTQVKVARMMGQMAVQMGQSEAEKRMAKTRGPLRDVLSAMGVVAPAKPSAAPTPNGPSTPTTAEPETTPTPRKTTARKTTARKTTARKTPARKTAARKTPAKKTAARKTPARKASVGQPSVASLGIPDYDSLSASQVVNRLRGLAATDLGAVQAYEAATRARKTILNRITQLQKD